MIKEMLNAANIPAWPVRCADPPPVTYALYSENVTTDGPDGQNRIFTHSATIELYEPTLDEEAELAIERVLSEAEVHWTKQDRYWLSAVQRYQTVYEFTYINKT